MISEKHSIAARKNLIKAESAKKSKRVTKICPNCGKEFSLSPSEAARAKCCSKECRYAYMRGENAPNYGKGENIRGERNPMWKGGVQRAKWCREDVARQNRWRRKILYRDNYKCQKCGVEKDSGIVLIAHHIIPWKESECFRYDVENGVTLCEKCHKWVHGKDNINSEFIRHI